MLQMRFSWTTPSEKSPFFGEEDMPGEKEGNDDDEDGVGDGVDDPDGIVWSDGVHPDLNEVMVTSGVYGSPVISEEDRVKKAVLKAECLVLDDPWIPSRRPSPLFVPARHLDFNLCKLEVRITTTPVRRDCLKRKTLV